MFALGYTIVGILLGMTFVVALGICLGLWFGVRAGRPEAMPPSSEGRRWPTWPFSS